MLDHEPSVAPVRRRDSAPAPAEPLLGQILVTPTPVRAGEAFVVDVKAPDGSSYPDDFDRISIGGLLTPRRYLSFRRPGERAIVISARNADGSVARTRIPVEVLPSDQKSPSLEIEPALEDGTRVRFRVSWPAKLSRTDEERPANRRLRETARVLAKRTPQRGHGALSRKERSKLAESAHSFISVAAEKASQRAAAQFVAAAAHAAVSQAARVAAASGGPRISPEKAGAAAAAAAASATLASMRAAAAYSPPNGDNDLPKTTYTWDFGWGPFVSTRTPAYSYDFAERLDVTRPRTVFHVKVEVHEPGRDPFVLTRTISMANPYHPSRVKGIIRPIVRSDVNAVLVMDAPRHYRASLRITNRENEALTLAQHQFEPLYVGEAPEDRPPRIPYESIRNALRAHLDVASGPRATRQRAAARSRFFTSRALTATPIHVDFSDDWLDDLVRGRSIVIPPGDTVTVEVRLPDGALSKHAVGFAVHYRGMSASGRQVRASGYFDIPGRFPRLDAIDAAIASTLAALAGYGLVPKRKTILTGDIARIARRSAPAGSLRRGAVQQAVTVKNPYDFRSDDRPMTPLSGSTDEILEGHPCDPYNLPSVIPDGWVCQATSEKEYRWVPPRFVNARQGDIILSPGGDGLIAQLLRQVNPPQNYSHSGIMSRNQTEVTHSTASESRLLAYPEGSFDEPTDGLQPDALRFLWPGVVKQTVQQSVDGQSMQDPQAEPGDDYLISGFNPDFSGTTGDITPALVVKPDPFEETSEIRKQLRHIGAFASEQHGKSHYRFFAYTDPTVALSQVAPESAGWAAGTYPTVCSSFVWFCARSQQATLEGSSLEPDDLESDVKVDPPESGEDGLYRYTAEERLAAGEFIYQWLTDMVWDSAEGFGNWVVFFSDMADDVANQVLNTFESDWAETDAKDSENWRNPSDADAVSPDNLLRWDGPSGGGLWGTSEPLIYRTARYEYLPKHVWKKVDKVGSLHGTVLFDEQPVDGATIELSGGQFAAFSGSDGTFAFIDVPVGLYQLTAYRVVDAQGTLQSTLEPMDVEITEDDQDIVVRLSGPNPDYREIIYDVEMHVKDFEFAAAAHPHEWEYYEGVAHVGPSDPYVELGPFSCLCDNDVLAHGWIDLEWKPDRSVQFRRRLRLYDGSEPDDDSWNHSSSWKSLAPGQTRSGSTSIGDMSDSEDAVEMSTSLRNDVDMS